MTVILPPPLVFQGQLWSTDALTGMAVGLRRALGGECRRSTGRLAMVMANRPQSVALFFALSSCSVPLVLLPPDMKPWRSDPPLPRDTLLVLLESERDLEPGARSLDVPIAIIEEPEPPGGAPEADGHSGERVGGPELSLEDERRRKNHGHVGASRAEL